MAAQGETQNDMEAHAQSYSLFAGMMKWGAIASIVVAFVVVLIIAN